MLSVLSISALRMAWRVKICEEIVVFSLLKSPLWIGLALLFGSTLMAACIQLPTDSHARPMPVNIEEIAGGKTAVALHYQGPQEVGMDDTAQCATMTLDRSQNVTIGACDGTSRVLALGKRFALDWDDIQNRFASFVYQTPTETLTFTGRGTISGEAWQRAIVTWARMTRAELATGRASATSRTVMSWFFGEVPDQAQVCEHLTVLSYGYAYAETVDCEGGAVIDATGDWLTDAEMVQLDQWLYQRSAFYSERNYLDGKGQEAMSSAEGEAVGQWASAVRSRIWPAQ